MSSHQSQRLGISYNTIHDNILIATWEQPHKQINNADFSFVEKHEELTKVQSIHNKVEINSRHNTMWSYFVGLVLLVVCAAVSAQCPDKPLNSLSIDEVQSLLQDWQLDNAFAKEFKEQQVSGYLLKFMDERTLSVESYANAQPFHVAALFARIKECSAPTPVQQQASASRRQLQSDSEASTSGIRIKSNNSVISLGPEADVNLRRTGDSALTVESDIHLCGHGLHFCNLFFELVHLFTDEAALSVDHGFRISSRFDAFNFR